LEAYGIDSSLISIDNDYNLKLGPADWDVKRFCELCENNTEDRLETLEEIVMLYESDYLHGEYYPWSDFERERLSRRYDHAVIKLSNKYGKEKKYDLAEKVLLNAYHRNPFSEDITELLLRLYNETGSKSSAKRHFNAYAAMIKEELGIQPDKRLAELVKH
jgi:two-component SAPR family response regulator